MPIPMARNAAAPMAKQYAARAHRAASVSPPGGSGTWQLTPDQRDRNSQHSLKQLRRKRKVIARKRSLEFDDRPQNT